MLPAGLSIGSGVRGGAPVEPTALYSFSFFDTYAASFPSIASLSGNGWQTIRGFFVSAYCQLSASSFDGPTVSTGGSACDGRVQEFSATRRGFLIEPDATNLIFRSHALQTVEGGLNGQWLVNSGGTYTSSGTSPRVGVTDGQRIQVTSGGYGNFAALQSAAAGSYTGSLWSRSVSGTTPMSTQYGPTQYDAYTATTAWTRRIFDATKAASPDVWYLTQVQSATPQAMDVYADYAQVEAGQIATSQILTTGAAATRTGDSLTLLSAGSLIGAGNRLSVELQFVPLGPLSYMGGVRYLWLWGSNGGNNTWLTFNPSTRIATLHVHGASDFDFPTPLPDCARGDLYAVNLSTTSGGVSTLKARVHNGVSWSAATNCGSSGVLSSVTNVTPTFLPANGSIAAQTMPCMVDRVRTFAPGDVPVWAL
jgi:hypothetical protein